MEPPPSSSSSFNSFYHRTAFSNIPNCHIPNPNCHNPNPICHNPNPKPNCDPPTNAVYSGGSQRAMVSPEQPINITNNNNNITNNSINNNINNVSSSSSPYSECKTPPTAIFVHPVSERASCIAIARPDSTFKRKRGRPRKYGTDVDGIGAMGLGVSSPSFSLSEKRAAVGSGKKAQMLALGCAGQGFTAHVITIAAGEDVCKKIIAFMQHGPRAFCVLSANGAISNATLHQPAMSGGIVTYEGRYEILSLSGSFLLTEVGGIRTREGSLSVSLAGSDGRVVGGGVGGLLTAATPVQVIVGTFLVDSKKDLVCIGNGEPAVHTLSASVSGGLDSSPAVMQSRIEASPSSKLGKECHGEQNAGSCSYNVQSQVMNMTSLQSMDWASPHYEVETKCDTDTTLTGKGKSMDQIDELRPTKGDEEEDGKDQNVTYEH